MTGNRSHAFRIASALMAANLLIGWTVALAANFASDCCADLEDRINQLEEVVVAKGKRQVTLRVSGQVSRSILFFDDGWSTKSYVVSNSNSGDRFRFDGRAKIRPDLTAGFYYEFSSATPSSSGADQLSIGRMSPLQVRQSIVYLDSKRLGSLTLGFGSPASEDIVSYELGGMGIAATSNTAAFGGNFFTRDATLPGSGGLNALSSGNTISMRWRRFVPEIDTPKKNIIRYDSPVLMDTTVSASWGENDFWDVALRYAKRANGLRFAFGVGYAEDREEDPDTFGWPRGGDSENPDVGNTIVRELKGSVSMLHERTGLFFSGTYVHREFAGTDPGTRTFACINSGDAADIRALGIACTNRPSFHYFWLGGGVRMNALSVGPTVLYTEYARSFSALDGLNVSVSSAIGGDIDFVRSSRMDVLGAGIVQNLSAAGMEIFLSYRHLSADVTGLETSGAILKAPLKDADVVMIGTRIRF